MVNSKKKIKMLILLGIFFIVSAIFIGNTIQKIMIKQTKLQLKKEFSSYSTALNNIVTESDDDINCYFTSDKKAPNEYSGCREFFVEFVKQLKVSKYCPKNALLNKCVPLYSEYTKEPSCAGYDEKMINEFNPAFMLNSRSSFIMYKTPKGGYRPLFAIDVNGLAKPNKPGHDLFSFVIIKNKTGSYYLHPNIIFCLPETEGALKNITDIYD